MISAISVFLAAIAILIAVLQSRKLRTLRESEVVLQSTLRSIGDAVIVTDARGRVTFMNAVAELLTGWDLSSARQQSLSSVFNIVNETTRDKVPNPVERVLQDGTIVGLANHTILISRSGVETPIDDSAAPIRLNERAEITGVVLVFRDVSERRRSEQERENILSRITDGFSAVDKEWRLTYVNKVGAKRIGRLNRNPADLLGKNIWEEFKDLKGTYIEEQYRRAMSEQTPITIEFQYLPLNSWFESTLYPSAEGLSIYSRDITSRKAAEERAAAALAAEQAARALAETARHRFAMLAEAGIRMASSLDFQTTIDNIAQLLVPSFADWVIIDVVESDGSVRGAAVKAASEEKESLLWEVRRRYPPRPDSPQPAALAIKTGRPAFIPELDEERIAKYVYDDTHMDLMRRLAPRSAIAVPLGARGKMVGAISAVWSESRRRYTQDDVVFFDELARRIALALDNSRLYQEIGQANTKLTELARDLQNQRRWLEDILNLAPTPILLVEPNTAKVTFANAAADKLAGGEYPKNVPAEQYDTVYICTDTRGKRIPNNEMPGVRVARGERLDGFEMTWHSPAGACNVLLLADTLPAMHGHPATCVVVFQDITKLKEVENEIRNANHAKDQFLAMVSHELRTPLNAIMGWARMLAAGTLDPERTVHAIRTIERSARAQAQVIEDLLDVSRIISGKMRLDVQPLELSTSIAAAVDTVRPAADAKEIVLDLVLDPRAGPVSGDSGRMQQIVWNLLSNAIKFTPRHGKIQIRLERINSHVELTVTDTGIGIEPEFIPFVFDLFRQSDSSTTRRQCGLGLGMSIARSLVEMHGGTIHVFSRGIGQGATFTVKLPVLLVRDSERFPMEHRRHPSVEQELIEQHEPILTGLRALVVDDDLDACEMMTTLLEQRKVRVITAKSAAEARTLFELGNIDIVVSDIEMPGEDGYALIRHCREFERNSRMRRIPAVALTAHARIEDRLKALAAGFDMHVPKPVEQAELLAVIASLTRRHATA